MPCVEVATAGVEAENLTCYGYLRAVADNLRDEDLHRQVSDTVRRKPGVLNIGNTQGSPPNDGGSGDEHECDACWDLPGS
jgi:hypothetical protein